MKTGSRSSDCCEVIQPLVKGKNMKFPSGKGKNTGQGSKVAPTPSGEATGACYVCGRTIKSTPVYIGKGIYRHERCYPGSARWLNSEVGHASSFYPLFIN